MLFSRFISSALPLALLAAGLHPQMPAPMVNPAIDQQPGPFSYYSHSVDEIGVMDAPQGAEITPEGSLYTGYGELVFLTGPGMTPIEIGRASVGKECRSGW